MTEGFVPVPNVYFEYLAELSGAELKVLLAILRKTAGWRKESDEISLRQLEKMTGLARHSVIAGLRGLLKRGLIVQIQAAVGSKATSYTCVIPPATGAKSAPVAEPEDDGRCKKCTSRGAKSAPLGGAKTAPEGDERCKNCTTSGAETAPLAVQKLHQQHTYTDNKQESARESRALSLSSESSNGKVRDYLDHVLDRLAGYDPAERTIRAWSLPPHLEAQCLAFARVFEVAPTKSDKARWAKAAETLHELRCDETRLKAARDEARKASLICTWPGAVINLHAIRSTQQEYELVYDEERNAYVRKPKRD